MPTVLTCALFCSRALRCSQFGTCIGRHNRRTYLVLLLAGVAASWPVLSTGLRHQATVAIPAAARAVLAPSSPSAEGWATVAATARREVSAGLCLVRPRKGAHVLEVLVVRARDGTTFDAWTSGVVIVGYAIPGFLFAVMLLIFFAGGSYLQAFPLRGLTSDGFALMSWPEKIVDYFWHIALPVLAMSISGFATLTLLTKNSFLDEIRKQYVMTARAKGLTERKILYGHVFRNAMLIVIAGFPGAFISIFFTGAFIIEIVFSLDGLGLLGYESVLNRDYPVVFGTLFLFSLMGMVVKLISDLTYVWIDPRIDFESREA